VANEATHPQQIGEVGSVALVVLHSAHPPVLAERVGEVHLAAEAVEVVDEPVPAVAALDHHRWPITRCLMTRSRVNRSELSTLVVSSVPPSPSSTHDHAAASAQIDSDVLSLSFHGFPSFVVRGGCGDPECYRTRSLSARGGFPWRRRLRHLSPSVGSAWARRPNAASHAGGGGTRSFTTSIHPTLAALSPCRPVALSPCHPVALSP
jgi:hypothetical protein